MKKQGVGGGVAVAEAKTDVGSNGNSAASEMGVILAGLLTMRDGDFSVRLPGTWTGLTGKVADTFNEVIELNDRMATELERISRVVGKEGKINERVTLGAVRGSWEDVLASVNALIALARPSSANFDQLPQNMN